MDPKMEIIDFFNQSGRFSEKSKDYVGMAGSQWPDVFFKFYQSLRADDQDALVKALVEMTFEDSKYNINCLSQIFDFLLRKEIEPIRPFQRELEKELEDPKKLSVWLSEVDPSDPSNDKTTWREAGTLIAILEHLGSKRMQKIADRIEREAKSEHFKQTVRCNRKSREILKLMKEGKMIDSEGNPIS